MKEKAKEFAENSKKKIKEEGKKAKNFAEEKWDDVKDYSLDDIAKMSNAKVKELIKNIDTEKLAKVLKNAKVEVKEKILPNMTKKAKEEYDRVEKEIKSISKEDVKNFTKTIESEIKNLFKKK
jgi:flagellar motor switch protein FliG